MAEMTPEVWDDEFCHTMRPSPETIAAALRDDDEALDAALRELDQWRKRAAELKAALAPFAAMGKYISRDASDNAKVPCELSVGDVRRARRVMGEGSK